MCGAAYPAIWPPRALTQAARAIEAVRAENQVFFMNSEHQPCALISPSTSLQLCGGWKLMHPSQRCVSFGLSWYATAFCGTLACAPARFNPRPQAAEAPTAQLATRWNKTRRERCFGLLG